MGFKDKGFSPECVSEKILFQSGSVNRCFPKFQTNHQSEFKNSGLSSLSKVCVFETIY